MNTRRITTDMPMLNDPFFIGFDKMIDKLNTTYHQKDNYPPYNVIKTGENTYLLEIAAAGFSEEDFDVELYEGVLRIKTDTSSIDEDAQYLHKGIAMRGFERRFTLADTIEVDNITLDQGMLRIRLENIVPESKKPKKIPIGRQLDPELLNE